MTEGVPERKTSSPISRRTALGGLIGALMGGVGGAQNAEAVPNQGPKFERREAPRTCIAHVKAAKLVDRTYRDTPHEVHHEVDFAFVLEDEGTVEASLKLSPGAPLPFTAGDRVTVTYQTSAMVTDPHGGHWGGGRYINSLTTEDGQVFTKGFIYG